MNIKYVYFSLRDNEQDTELLTQTAHTPKRQRVTRSRKQLHGLYPFLLFYYYFSLFIIFINFICFSLTFDCRCP